MRTLIFALCLALSGCATLEQHAREHPETTAAQTVFVACRAADAYTTLRVLAQGGKEMNPFMAGFVHNIPQFLLVQGLLTLIAVWAEDKLNPHVALGISVASCLPALHNFGQIK